MFYPAEPDALNALIADVRKRARPDGSVAPKVVVAPHAGLVYSGSVAATAFGPWARRAEPPRRIVIVGPAHRVAFRASRSIRRRNGARRWAKRRSRPLLMPSSLRLRAFSSTRGRSWASIRSKCTWRCAGDAAGDVRNRPHPGRRRRSALSLRPCAGSGAGRRRSSRSPPTCRIFSTKDAPSHRFRHRPAHRDAGRRRARWAPGLRLLGRQGRARDRRRARHAGDRPASGDIGGCGRGRFAGRRLRRFRVRIRGLGPACRGRSRASAFGLHDRPRRGGADRRKAPALSLNGLSPALSPWRATFVTLTENERLRGCIGSLSPHRPLIEDALANTAQAAFADPRFPPLKESDSRGFALTSRSSPIRGRCWREASLRTRERARARPRRAHSLGRQAPRPVPAERLAPPPRRARVRAPPDGEGGLRGESLAERAGG